MKADEEFEFGYRHGRQLSHFLVDVTAHGYDHLARVLNIVFSSTLSVSNATCATHCRVDGDRQITFYRALPVMSEPSSVRALPGPLPPKQAADFVWAWLQQVAYPQDEHDGSSIKGWRAYNETFGIVDGCWQAFVAIRPMWIYLPK